jgi:hypothetical protein
MNELIRKATKAPKLTSGGNSVASLEQVDSTLLRPIKALCRQDDDYTTEAARYLLIEIKHISWIVRLRTLNVIDCLFIRSRLFRELICDSVKIIAEGVGFLASNEAPSLNAEQRNSLTAVSGPARVVVRAKELLELWDMQFGQYLPRLRALARYLRESLKVRMPNLQERILERRVQQAATETQQRRVLMLKRNKALDELQHPHEGIAVMQREVERMDEYMELLFPGVSSDAAPIVQSLTSTDVGQPKPKIEIHFSADRKRTRSERDDTDENLVINGNHEDVMDHIEEDGVEDCDIDWEDAEDEPNEDQEIDQEAEIAAAIAVVPAGGVVLNNTALTADDTATADNEAILVAARDHALHLSRAVRVTLAKWMKDLIASQERPPEHENETSSARVIASSYLRQIALLNARLYRVLSHAGQFFKFDYLQENS